MRNDLFYKLGLDSTSFRGKDDGEEMKKRNRTPSPIKRIEDSLYINNVHAMDFSMTASNFCDLNSSFMS